jgi:hypothetical protein
MKKAELAKRIRKTLSRKPPQYTHNCNHNSTEFFFFFFCLPSEIFQLLRVVGLPKYYSVYFKVKLIFHSESFILYFNQLVLLRVHFLELFVFFFCLLQLIGRLD